MKQPVYRADPELALMADQVAFLFHVMIGVDAVGDFQACTNLGIDAPSYHWAEAGRNHAERSFPFTGPRRLSEVTLRWGMLIRSKLYDWMSAVEIGYGFRRDVYILQLTRQKVPMRLMRLSQAFPVSWRGADLDSNDSRYAVESLTLAYEDMALVTNKALLLPLAYGSGRDPEDEEEGA